MTEGSHLGSTQSVDGEEEPLRDRNAIGSQERFDPRPEQGVAELILNIR